MESSITVIGSDRPLRDADAICEGCGARGIVGRATRQDSTGTPREEHCYCADCWPEWSAFYRARWREQGRRKSLEWHDRPRDDKTPPPAPWGMSFESATWHGVVELVQKLTEQSRYYREPPSKESLARMARDIRAAAGDKVGAMPREVRAFLAEFGRDDVTPAETSRSH
jgi:hypothetical protein